MNALRQYPLFVLLMMIGGLAMLVPAGHAAKQQDWLTARVFFQYSILVLTFSVLIGTAMMNRKVRNVSRANLITLILGFALLPAFLALPFWQVLPYLSFERAYFEMLSSFTTTGATLFDDPFRISESLHLWRGLVAWLGGFFMLVAAVSVLEPLNIGGFEMRETMAAAGGPAMRIENDVRLLRAVRALLPPYFLFTALLALLLIFSGERVFIATIHAMSTLSTSAISPVSGMENAHAGWGGELLIAVFLLFAVSSKLMTLNLPQVVRTIPKDPEFHLTMLVIGLLPIFMFARHWLAALDVAQGDNAMAGLSAYWGSLFTTISYLTTTGFESSHWHDAQRWSGLSATGILLFGLAVMGGGVATTAGGVKLLRIYALYRHGLRELEHMVNPSSVGRSGTSTRRFRRQGAELAWVFLMLFLMAITVVALALAMDGILFEDAFALAIASLTNTGPIYLALGDPSAHYATLSDTALGIISVAMVLGRVEALAFIALLNPDYWRN
ncbi:MAG: hypothetical protein COB08_017640 [Rhodobacteraceae bacterium]|nr:hypothetical protein [Paracoccaceae bacterium]